MLQDDVNDRLFVRPGQALTRGLVKVDNDVIDGAVRGVGGVVAITSQALRKIQNGYARSYALVMVIGVLALIATLWMVTL